MASTKNIKVTIGGPESVPGVAEAMEYVVPIRGVPDLDSTIERQEDPAITGSNMSAGAYAVSEDNKGGLPLAFRPSGGIGKLCKSLIGQEETPAQVGACIRIRYTGTSASCKIVPSAAGDTLASSVGALGAESADAAFGTAGVIDLTAAGFDTVAELVAAIEAYTYYECELVTGAGAVSTALILDFTSPGNYRQGKNTWAYIWFGSTTSGAYMHEMPADLTDTERPVYSVQKDGFQDNYLYDGCVTDRLSLSGSLKAMIEADCDILAMKETAGQSASVLTMDDVDPLMFWNGSTSIGGVDYTYVRSFSIEIKNNHNAEGYGQGLITRQYQQKAAFEVTGDITVRLDASSIAERPKVKTGTMVAVSLWLKGKVIGASVEELCILELPACTIEAFAFEDNNGVLDAKLSIKAHKPKGTMWNDPFTMTLVSAVSAAH